MSFKTIMVQLDVDAIAAPCISFAWDLAQRHEADEVDFNVASNDAVFKRLGRHISVSRGEIV
ncbi:hypothetical protein EJ066_18100 [Mesorhizobium sp. M9A.F.Ca.ET.002.03.1.2]|uniref:hypothetical protein n=1 Tax=Mesorhizobium sp. M9A.F.Ca.ET.002.03.1.2 TaxID=2493668 RepID=UPI000F75B6F5|nr:hypothetical protein [Mesorhizobium sp. M9A.F.Ca.ET.002.03.1.2]AZN98899.1 hypothetical protein EJ066_18100 [Mesorhizobium sp. M9A.F.Ca.ET.002.03.1.2]